MCTATGPFLDCDTRHMVVQLLGRVRVSCNAGIHVWLKEKCAFGFCVIPTLNSFSFAYAREWGFAA